VLRASSLDSGLLYHVVYHRSLALHVNHLLFLQSYELGVLLLLCAGSGWLSAALAGLYAAYAAWLAREKALPFLVSLAGLAVAASYTAAALGAAGLARWEIALLGLGLVLGSFLLQLLGHWLFEEFNAKPSLLHGFVSAPILEGVVLLFRLGFYPALASDVFARAEALRAEARAESERDESERQEAERDELGAGMPRACAVHDQHDLSRT
jgi:uncharacterized membrane protein YGL010W